MRRLPYTLCLLLIVAFFAYYKKDNIEEMPSEPPNETDTAYTISATSPSKDKNDKMNVDNNAEENFKMNIGGAGNGGN